MAIRQRRPERRGNQVAGAAIAVVVAVLSALSAQPSSAAASPAPPTRDTSSTPGSVCRTHNAHDGDLAPGDSRTGVTFKACGEEDPDGPPPVPAGSVCRLFSNGLSAQDARIGVVLDHESYPFQFTFNFGSYLVNYLFAQDGNGMQYGLSNLHSNVLASSGASFSYMKVCIVDPGPAMSPFTSRYALVAQMYRDFLGRPATTAEHQLWAASGRTREQILSSFVDGDAATRGPLVRLYKAFYKRWPDAGGYDYWIRKMKTGTSLTSVSNTFAAASEFKAKYGSLSNSAFVKLVYENVLERQPDSGGLAFWIKRLDAKKISRGALMLQFSESSEYQRKFGPACDLVGVSLRMLRRAPTSTELTDWSTKTPNQLATYLLTLPEYADRIQAG